MVLGFKELVGVAAGLEQHSDQTQRRELVVIVGAPARAVFCQPVRCCIAHQDGVVKRAHVRHCAQLEHARGKVEAIIDDGDAHCRCPVTIDQVQVGTGIRERQQDIRITLTCRPHRRGESAGRKIGARAALR